jgi:hypothetical protein
MEESYTRNIKFAAFLRMKGIHPDQVKKMSRGKAIYSYNSATVTPDAWEALKAEFDKSEFLTYAQSLDAILDLAY